VIFLAIITHKWIEAFSLGASIARSTSRVDVTLKLLLAFALSTPFGQASPSSPLSPLSSDDADSIRFDSSRHPHHPLPRATFPRLDTMPSPNPLDLIRAGILIGLLVRSSLQDKPTEGTLAKAGLNSLASGTFLYVGIVDTFVHEFESSRRRYINHQY
jgi:hypothetical protein